MGLFNLFKEPADDVIAVDYDAIDADLVQSNLLMCTETEERQKLIRNLSVGSIVNVKHTRKNKQNIYMVTDYRNGNVIGELSYGTSDFLAQNYKNHKMLGKVTEIGKITPTGRGKQVRIEYKVYL